MTTASLIQPGPISRHAFQPVSLSLADLCGEDYVRALCHNHALLTGENPVPVTESAFKRVEFFPQALERRLLQLLPKVGQKVGTRLASSAAGASSRAFVSHTKVSLAPLGTLGYFRIGEDGHLYLTAKSEHYHAPLGHSFPGFHLLERARRLGIPNATHNSTRGLITRRLEEELVASANGIAPDDHASLANVMASSAPDVLNRVLNLETGSLAAEAALKFVLARFYRSDETVSAPQYHGRSPVVLVIGNDDGGLKANYHGTTLLTQMMRGMWPELYAASQERGFRVVAIRPDSIADLETAFGTYETAPWKIAGFFHEIVMMNYGGRLLSREFLQRAYELCRQHDVPAVADEIQSCLWAPGFFLHREFGLHPSFVALGKGFPGGEYAASRILFSAAYDALPQFGALVTNGQEEIASLAYLVSMRWVAANREVITQIGDYYAGRLRDLAGEFPAVLASADGSRHLSCLRFKETRTAVTFASRLVEHGIDVSAQTYKPDCPPSVLTKLPLIAGDVVVDFIVDRMRAALLELRP